MILCGAKSSPRPICLTTRQATHENLGMINALLGIGYHVRVFDYNISVSDIEGAKCSPCLSIGRLRRPLLNFDGRCAGELKNNIVKSGCCGMAELTKLGAYGARMTNTPHSFVPAPHSCTETPHSCTEPFLFAEGRPDRLRARDCERRRQPRAQEHGCVVHQQDARDGVHPGPAE